MTGDIEKRPDSHVIEVARELDSQIRQLAHHAHVVLDALRVLVEEAQATKIHEVLGYPSWTAYLADALDGQWNSLLDRDKRIEAIRFPAEQGMSQRAIAKVTGAGKGTVQREIARLDHLDHLITGLDGRMYPRPEPREDQLGPPDEESDEEFLARLYAEREARKDKNGRVTFTIPATIEEADEVARRIVGEQRRLRRNPVRDGDRRSPDPVPGRRLGAGREMGRADDPVPRPARPGRSR